MTTTIETKEADALLKEFQDSGLLPVLLVSVRPDGAITTSINRGFSIHLAIEVLESAARNLRAEPLREAGRAPAGRG